MYKRILKIILTDFLGYITFRVYYRIIENLFCCHNTSLCLNLHVHVYLHNGKSCGKDTKFSVDCNDIPLYLCKYQQNKRTIFSRINYLLGYPNSGWRHYKVDFSASFLLDDCWKAIIIQLLLGQIIGKNGLDSILMPYILASLNLPR